MRELRRALRMLRKLPPVFPLILVAPLPFAAKRLFPPDLFGAKGAKQKNRPTNPEEAKD